MLTYNAKIGIFKRLVEGRNVIRNFFPILELTHNIGKCTNIAHINSFPPYFKPDKNHTSSWDMLLKMDQFTKCNFNYWEVFDGVLAHSTTLTVQWMDTKCVFNLEIGCYSIRYWLQRFPGRLCWKGETEVLITETLGDNNLHIIAHWA